MVSNKLSHKGRHSLRGNVSREESKFLYHLTNRVQSVNLHGIENGLLERLILYLQPPNSCLRPYTCGQCCKNFASLWKMGSSQRGGPCLFFVCPEHLCLPHQCSRPLNRVPQQALDSADNQLGKEMSVSASFPLLGL